MADGDYHAIPGAAAATSVTAAATTWANGTATAAVTIPSGLTNKAFDIVGFWLTPETPLSADVTAEFELDVLVGGNVVLTVPYSYRFDTAVGPYLTGFVPVPEGHRLAANPQLTYRLRGTGSYVLRVKMLAREKATSIVPIGRVAAASTVRGLTFSQALPIGRIGGSAGTAGPLAADAAVSSGGSGAVWSGPTNALVDDGSTAFAFLDPGGA
jgi:hypothetical protein